MEHLPRSSHDLKLKVPYICIEQYDQTESWLEYPQRQGISIEHLRYHEYRKYDTQDLERFLQNWLFFGLLDAILPCEVKLSEFITGDLGNEYVTTVALSRYLKLWEESQTSLPLARRAALFQRNSRILDEARKIVYTLAEYPANGLLQHNPFPPLRRDIALSCAVLGNSLSIANRAILNPGEDLETGLVSGLAWGGSAFFLELMESKGWCPFLLDDVQKGATLLSTYYMSTMGPPRVKRNHRNCSDFSCAALRIESHHAVEGCACLTVNPDMGDVVTEIQNGRTPVLRFHFDADREDSSKRVEVDTGHVATHYVAISHVWSDGLGNPDSNSMPRCQLIRVQKAVNELYKCDDSNGSPNSRFKHRSCFSGLCVRTNAWRKGVKSQTQFGKTGQGFCSGGTSAWFWIDTICVPTDKKYGKEKRMALDRMKDVYIKADKVLIIDSEVAACPSDSDPLEVLARIRLSNWNRSTLR